MYNYVYSIDWAKPQYKLPVALNLSQYGTIVSKMDNILGINWRDSSSLVKEDDNENW